MAAGGQEKTARPVPRSEDLKKDWPLLAAITAALLCLLAMGLLTWVKMDDFGDTRVYHYPRVALWLQNQTVFFTPETAAHIPDERIVGTEPVSDILYLWVFVATRSMRTLNIVEWAAVIPVMIAIYGIALKLVKKRRPALLAALTYLSYEMVIWDLSHANAVLSSIALILAGLYFVMWANEEHRWQWVMFACLGLALGVGAKATTYYMAPFLAIILLVVIIRGVKAAGWRHLGLWLGFGIGSLLLFTAGNYIQNILIYGGPVALVAARESSPVTKTFSEYIGCSAANIPRLTYLSLQLDPLPAALEAPAWSAWASFGRNLGIDTITCTRTDPLTLNWYGFNLLYPLVFLGGLFFSIRAARAQKDHWRPLLWLLWGGFSLVFALMMSFHAPHYRYFAIPAAIFCALAVDLYAALADRRVLWTALCLFAIYATVFFTVDAYRENFRDMEAFKAYLSDEGQDRYAINAFAPAGSDVLAFFGGKYTTDIMLFGDHAERRVSFASCSNLLEALRAGEADLFVDVWYEQTDRLSECRQHIGEEDTAAIELLLAEDYALVYQGLHTAEPVSLYLPIDAVSESDLYPTTFPPSEDRISVHPSYQGLIGAGPIYYNAGSIGAHKRIDFGLRAAESGLTAPIDIEFFGAICLTDTFLNLEQRDSTGGLIASIDIPVREIGDSVYESFFTATLIEGINRFSIADSDCDPPVDFPLYFSRIWVAPDITGTGVRILEGGWYGLEFTTEGQPFRWANNDAAFSLAIDQPGDFVLTIGAQSGPGYAGEPFTLEVRDDTGEVVGSAEVTGQWAEVSIPLSIDATGEAAFSLHTEGGGLAAEGGDARIMNFLVTGISLIGPVG